ncbi:hypothetical protein [Paenibacillus phytohabitans]|uniref:hypothetical protein n=1 Tax=Paenibacillus phytohabitans TaxID=2654978 RepID=UPI00300BE0A9
MSIQYKKYTSVKKYIERKSRTKFIQSFHSNKLTLIRGALIVGLAPKAHLKLTKELIDWKISTIVAFINDTSPFEIQNADELEMSERVTVAYFIGMVFAQIHMQKKYQVRHMEHLKSSGITAKSRVKDKKNPDLWGYNPKKKKSYLVEAKGSTVPTDYFDNDKIRKAEKQLNAITEIQYSSPGGTLIFNKASSNLKKIIIATHPNLNKEIMQHVIDPIKEEDKIIKINGDELVYKHYSHLIKFIKSGESKSIELEKLPGLKFRVVDYISLNCSIGVLEEIYNLLEHITEKDNITEEDIRNVSTEINKFLDNIDDYFIGTSEFKDFSIGIDGVLVFNKDLN